MKKRKFHVYIIESPSDPDLYHKRFEGESLMKTLKLSGIPSSHRLAVSQKALEAAFYIGTREYFEKTKPLLLPIIHISAHGYDQGIELTNGDIIKWAKLKKLLLPLNKALDGILLLSLSSCMGASGCTMSMHDDDFPFSAIIGNTSEPTWGETNIAYATFYHLFAKGESIKNAIKTMKLSSGNDKFVFLDSRTARKAYLETIKAKDVLDNLEENIPKNKPDNIEEALDQKSKRKK